MDICNIFLDCIYPFFSPQQGAFLSRERNSRMILSKPLFLDIWWLYPERTWLHLLCALSSSPLQIKSLVEDKAGSLNHQVRHRRSKMAESQRRSASGGKDFLMRFPAPNTWEILYYSSKIPPLIQSNHHLPLDKSLVHFSPEASRSNNRFFH